MSTLIPTRKISTVLISCGAFERDVRLRLCRWLAEGPTVLPLKFTSVLLVPKRPSLGLVQLLSRHIVHQ